MAYSGTYDPVLNKKFKMLGQSTFFILSWPEGISLYLSIFIRFPFYTLHTTAMVTSYFTNGDLTYKTYDEIIKHEALLQIKLNRT